MNGEAARGTKAMQKEVVNYENAEFKNKSGHLLKALQIPTLPR